MIKPRPATQAAMNLKQPVTVAEIGVYQGVHALSMFQNLEVEKMYLIDPYEVYDEPSSGMGKTPDFPDNEQIARKNLYLFEDRCKWIKKRSQDVELVPVDFVYIDGSHEYENVKADLEYYSEVTQKILGGHDYFSKQGVRRAVNEFCLKNNLKLNMRRPDWWIML